MRNRILTVLLICSIIYCTSTNPVIGDDYNNGTEKYKGTHTQYGKVYNEFTYEIIGDLEKHRNYSKTNWDNKGRICYKECHFSDGSFYVESIDSTGTVTSSLKTERIK